MTSRSVESTSRKRFLNQTVWVTASIIVSLFGLVAYAVARVAQADAVKRQYIWVQATAKANWEPGYAFTALAFGDRLWVFGKNDGDWFSDDGRNWTKSPTRGNLPKGSGFNAYIVFHHEVYAVGGAEDRFDLRQKAVWKTKDGINWTLVTQSPEWSARVWHQLAVFDGKLWLMGGYDGGDKNDVWSSDDGLHWKQVIAKAPWAGRCIFASAVFDNQLWVMGGRRELDSWFETDFNDVWHSADGIKWTPATLSAGWSKRFGHTSLVWDDKLWVMGGARFSANNEVWCSDDGVRWAKVGTADWTPRFAPASVVFRGKAWLMGGKRGGGRFTSDIWFLEPALKNG